MIIFHVLALIINGCKEQLWPCLPPMIRIYNVGKQQILYRGWFGETLASCRSRWRNEVFSRGTSQHRQLHSRTTWYTIKLVLLEKGPDDISTPSHIKTVFPYMIIFIIGVKRSWDHLSIFIGNSFTHKTIYLYWDGSQNTQSNYTDQ